MLFGIAANPLVSAGASAAGASSFPLNGTVTWGVATNTAPSCTGSIASDWRGEIWDSSPIGGFRSSITLQKNSGEVCQPDGVVGSWVALQNGGQGIAQVGYARISGDGFCRFYELRLSATNDTGAVPYNCTDSAGTITNFKVIEQTISGANVVAMYDCGPTGWTGCALEGPTTGWTGFGANSGSTQSEADYAASCVNPYLGSSSAPSKMNNNEGSTSEGGTMATRSMHDISTSVCGDYRIGTENNTTLTTYDSRN